MTPITPNTKIGDTTVLQGTMQRGRPHYELLCPCGNTFQRLCGIVAAKAEAGEPIRCDACQKSQLARRQVTFTCRCGKPDQLSESYLLQMHHEGREPACRGCRHKVCTQKRLERYKVPATDTQGRQGLRNRIECQTCSDMPHRRRAGGCIECGKAYEPERLPRSTGFERAGESSFRLGGAA